MKRTLIAPVFWGVMLLCISIAEGWAGSPKVVDSEPPNGSAGRPAASHLKAGADHAQGKGLRGRDAFLTLYRDAYQGAFYMLIPRGWKPEGGMISSGEVQ